MTAPSSLIALAEQQRGADARPRIYAGDTDLGETIDAAWSAIGKANHPPRLFRRDCQIVTVSHDEHSAGIRALSPYALQEILARVAAWCRERNGESRPAKAPLDVARVMHAGEPRLPPLNRVIRAPIIGRSGRIVGREGYDVETRTWFAPGSLSMPSVPSDPDSADVEAARNLLLNDLLGDFPFVSAADRANALAFVLLPPARELIDGPTPLHLFEKPLPGSGASLLVEAAGAIVRGGPPGFMSEGGDEDEWRKRITSALLDTPELIVIDNLRRRLDSAALSKALTDRLWIDRMLGTSRNVALPVRCCWAATGNNPAVSSEIARRCVPIRMDAKVDRPWERAPETFRHPRLLDWVHRNRADLLCAELILVRAWVTAGRPDARESLGSFERWAAVMGGILDVAGVEGFLTNRARFYDRADREIALWRAFVAAWWDAFGQARVGVKELWRLLDDVDPPMNLGRGSERSQRIRLGDGLRAAVDRRFTLHDVVLGVEAADPVQRAAQYRLVQLDGECRESSESFPHTCARARGEEGRHSPHSPDSQSQPRRDVERQP